MASAPDVAVLAFSVADGCAKILVPLLCFMGSSGPSPRGPAVDQAAVFLLLVLPMAYVSGVLVAHIAGVVLAYLHMATEPAAALSFADLGRFVVMVFTLVSAWLLVIAVPLAAFSFFFLGAGKRGTGSGFSWNTVS